MVERGPVADHPGMPLEDGIARFLAYLERERGYSPCTLRSYRGDLQQLARYLYPRTADPRLPLAAVRPEALAAFVDELGHRGLRPDSIARKVAALRSCFRFLVRSGGMAANPAASLRVDRTGGRAPAPLVLADIEAALDLPKAGTFRGARDRAILEAFYGGGLRLAELIGLNLTALHLDRGSVTVTGPGRRQRAVPLGGPAVAALRHYLHGRAELLIGLDITRVDAGALFINQRGRRLDRRTVQRLVQRHLGHVVAEGQLSPNTFRHTYAAHLVAAGADVVAVTRLLGRGGTVLLRSVEPPSLSRIQQVYAQAHPRAGGSSPPGAEATAPLATP